MFALQTQITLDGYLAGPNGEMDWMNPEFSPELAGYLDELSANVDRIILGRHLAEGFIPHWAGRPEYEPEQTIEFMNATPKVVISRTLTESPWEGTTVESDLVAAVERLKSERKNLIAYGGGQLAASLVEAGLCDELHLIVNPTAIGAGMPVFGKGTDAYEIAEVRRFDSGHALLRLTLKN